MLLLVLIIYLMFGDKINKLISERKNAIMYVPTQQGEPNEGKRDNQ